jgi:hypothetical protein
MFAGLGELSECARAPTSVRRHRCAASIPCHGSTPILIDAPAVEEAARRSLFG